MTTFAIHRFAQCASCVVIWAICLLLVAPASARADARLPEIFSEGMVLQRGMPIRIWGETAARMQTSVSNLWPRVFNLWNTRGGNGQVKNLPPRGTATMLHCLGVDHVRLTDVEGRVLRETLG